LLEPIGHKYRALPLKYEKSKALTISQKLIVHPPLIFFNRPLIKSG